MGDRQPLRERRKSKRLQYPFKLTHRLFKLGKQALDVPCSEGTIIDISESGLSFMSPVEYTAATLIYVEIRLGSWDWFLDGCSGFNSIYQKEPFCALAVVNRMEKIESSGEMVYKLAIQYVSVDEGHRVAVARFIQAWFRNHKKDWVHENSRC